MPCFDIGEMQGILPALEQAAGEMGRRLERDPATELILADDEVRSSRGRRQRLTSILQGRHGGTNAVNAVGPCLARTLQCETEQGGFSSTEHKRRAPSPRAKRRQLPFMRCLHIALALRLERSRAVERQRASAISAPLRIAVLDLVYIALGLALFGVTVAYAAACDRL